MVQLSLFAPTRRPICTVCGKLGTRWFQPMIGTENFCSIAHAQSYTFGHQHDGQARAIHTADCRHFDPTSEPVN